MDANKIFQLIGKSDFTKEYAELHWVGDYKTYLNMVMKKPEIARSAFQRLYDMVAGYGFKESVSYTHLTLPTIYSV